MFGGLGSTVSGIFCRVPAGLKLKDTVAQRSGSEPAGLGFWVEGFHLSGSRCTRDSDLILIFNSGCFGSVQGPVLHMMPNSTCEVAPGWHGLHPPAELWSHAAAAAARVANSCSSVGFMTFKVFGTKLRILGFNPYLTLP